MTSGASNYRTGVYISEDMAVIVLDWFRAMSIVTG